MNGPSTASVLQGLVSPVAEAYDALTPAPRPATLDGESVALVDSMLNLRAGWGDGILDAVAAELSQQWPRCTDERIQRPQLGVHEPDRWAKAMADRHAAIVIAVGD